MKSVKNYSYTNLIKMLIGEKVHFTSDCEFFPNFNIKCKVLSYKINKSELIFKVKTYPNNKQLDIGSNMKNLKFEIIKGTS